MANKELPNLKDVSRVPEELLPVVYWWQDKGPKTVAWVLGLVFIAGAVLFWSEQRKASNNNAVTALALASQPEDFEALVSQGGKIASLARLDLAHGLYNAGDYSSALSAYDAVLAELSDPALVDIAKVGRACALEALGRLDEAQTAIESMDAELTQASRPHYLTSEILFAKARILCQKGDKSAAKAALHPLLNANKDSPLAKYTPQAERLRQLIDAYQAPAATPHAALAAPEQKVTEKTK